MQPLSRIESVPFCTRGGFRQTGRAALAIARARAESAVGTAQKWLKINENNVLKSH
jgi:hypothetical protein